MHTNQVSQRHACPQRRRGAERARASERALRAAKRPVATRRSARGTVGAVDVAPTAIPRVSCRSTSPASVAKPLGRPRRLFATKGDIGERLCAWLWRRSSNDVLLRAVAHRTLLRGATYYRGLRTCPQGLVQAADTAAGRSQEQPGRATAARNLINVDAAQQQPNNRVAFRRHRHHEAHRLWRSQARQAAQPHVQLLGDLRYTLHREGERASFTHRSLSLSLTNIFASHHLRTNAARPH